MHATKRLNTKRAARPRSRRLLRTSITGALDMALTGSDLSDLYENLSLHVCEDYGNRAN